MNKKEKRILLASTNKYAVLGLSLIGFLIILGVGYFNLEFLSAVPRLSGKLFFWQAAIALTLTCAISFVFRLVLRVEVLAPVLAATGIIYLLATFLQTVALSEMGVPLSFGFLVTNWAPIRTLVPIWLMLVAGVLSVFGFCAVLAFLQAVTALWKRFASARLIEPYLLAIALLSAAVAHFSYPEGMKKLGWDPVVLTAVGNVTLEVSEQSIAINEREALSLDRFMKADQAIDGTPNVIIFMADSVNADLFNAHYKDENHAGFLGALRAQYGTIAVPSGRSSCADSICGIMSTFLSRSFSQMPTSSFLGLGTVLKKHQYEAEFVLVSDHMRWPFNRYQDFLSSQSDRIFDHRSTSTPINSDRIALEGLENIESTPKRPKLVFVFFFSTHIAGAQEDQFRIFSPGSNLSGLRALQGRFDTETQTQLKLNYRNKLAQLDHYLIESLNILDEKGILDNSVFVFTGDHGESLGRLGRLGHGVLNEDTLRVPIVMADTQGRFTDLSDKTMLQSDVAPSIVSALGLDVPEVWEGFDIIKKSSGMLSYHETGGRQFKDGIRCSAIHGSLFNFSEMRFSQCFSNHGAPRMTLFDLKEDPLEATNLWESLNAEEQKAFLRRLDQFLSEG